MASDRWDALLNDSTWYVPAANLLAYRLDADSPERPIPAADQTIWSIPEAEGGRFTGQSVAKIVDASGAVTRSRASMDGVVTRSGQARIVFTTAAGTTITGIGQVRRVNGEQAMEMQMITGGNGAFTTHWAYMLPLTSATEPPDPRTDQGDQRTYRSGTYRWLRGTSWSLTPRDGDRQQARGRFAITGYRNGYFWREGTRGRGNRSFQVLGSITPEGNLFFNAIGEARFQLRISQGACSRVDGGRPAPGCGPTAMRRVNSSNPCCWSGSPLDPDPPRAAAMRSPASSMRGSPAASGCPAPAARIPRWATRQDPCASARAPTAGGRSPWRTGRRPGWRRARCRLPPERSGAIGHWPAAVRCWPAWGEDGPGQPGERMALASGFQPERLSQAEPVLGQLHG